MRQAYTQDEGAVSVTITFIVNLKDIDDYRLIESVRRDINESIRKYLTETYPHLSYSGDQHEL